MASYSTRNSKQVSSLTKPGSWNSSRKGRGYNFRQRLSRLLAERGRKISQLAVCLAGNRDGKLLLEGFPVLLQPTQPCLG